MPPRLLLAATRLERVGAPNFNRKYLCNIDGGGDDDSSSLRRRPEPARTDNALRDAASLTHAHTFNPAHLYRVNGRVSRGKRQDKTAYTRAGAHDNGAPSLNHTDPSPPLHGNRETSALSIP